MDSSLPKNLLPKYFHGWGWGWGWGVGWGRDGLSDDKANLSPAKLMLADIGLELSLAKYYEQLISDVQSALENEDVIYFIMSEYEKGNSEEQYSENRAKRIDLLLKIAGDYSYSDYIKAIEKIPKRGSTALLKRDVDEVQISNYNPEWIEA